LVYSSATLHTSRCYPEKPTLLENTLVSMHPQPIGPIPEDTSRVARAAFPKGNVYIEMRNVLGTIYEDGDFAELFEVRGRPAIAPWRLALVTVMQFSEGLSDRQAAEAVRARIDWKYALGLQLTPALTSRYSRSSVRDWLKAARRGYFWRSCLRGARSAAISRCGAGSAPTQLMYWALCAS